MLTPSMGFCCTPLTETGSGSPAASRIVGATSITWWNWERISPFAFMPLGKITGLDPALEMHRLASKSAGSPFHLTEVTALRSRKPNSR
jgi:hypothetical protein